MIHVGIADLPPGLRLDRYFSKFLFWETACLTRNPAPSTKALRRWNKNFPGKAFSLVAPQGVFDPSQSEEALSGFKESIDALSPEIVVLRTPTGFSPSQQNRETVLSLADQLKELAGHIVLQGGSLWQRQHLATVAKQGEMTVAWDPLDKGPLAEPPGEFILHTGNLGYFRITPRRGKGVSEFDFELLQDLANHYEKTYVVMDFPKMYPTAISLLKFVAEYS